MLNLSFGYCCFVFLSRPTYLDILGISTMVLSKVIVTALKLFVNHHYYLTTSKVDRTLEREVINLLVQAQLETRTGSMRKRS